MEKSHLTHSGLLSAEHLAEYVKRFFDDLPLTTIIGINLLEPEYTSLLKELFYSARVQAWMMISRLKFKTEPVVLLLPLDSVLTDEEGDPSSTDSNSFQFFQNPSTVWHCHRDSTMVDKISPVFKMILKEDYLVETTPIRTEAQKVFSYNQRRAIDCCLGTFVRNLESSWFGSWKCFLLGEVVNSNIFNMVLENLVSDFKSKCKLNVNEGIL